MADAEESPVVSNKPRKRKINEGKANSKKKRRVSGHKTGPDCLCKRFRCLEQVTEENRKMLIDGFNSYETRNSRNAYLATLIETQNAKRRREKQGISDQNKDRNVSAKYYVFIKNGDSLTRVQACAKAFCSFFVIKHNQLKTNRNVISSTCESFVIVSRAGCN